MDTTLPTVQSYDEFHRLIIKHDIARPRLGTVPNFRQLKEINKIRKRICEVFNEIKNKYPKDEIKIKDEIIKFKKLRDEYKRQKGLSLSFKSVCDQMCNLLEDLKDKIDYRTQEIKHVIDIYKSKYDYDSEDEQNEGDSNDDILFEYNFIIDNYKSIISIAESLEVWLSRWNTMKTMDDYKSVN